LKSLSVERAEERVGSGIGDGDAAEGAQQVAESQRLEVRRVEIWGDSAEVDFALAHLEGDGGGQSDRVHL